MTANTVVAQEKSSVSSLAQALDRGYRFCGWGSTEAYLKLAFPAMAGRFVSMDGGRQMSRAMDDNICDAAIMEDVTWESVQGGESCDRLQKVLLPELIYSPGIALAVRDDLQRGLTWAISVARGTGQWVLAEQYARAKFIPPSTCESVEIMRKDSRSLDIDTGAGVLYLSFFLTTLGICRCLGPGE